MSDPSPNGLHDPMLAAESRNDRAVAAATLALAGLFCLLLGAQLRWSDAASVVSAEASLLTLGVGAASILASIRQASGGVGATVAGMMLGCAIVVVCAIPIQAGIIALTWLVAAPCAVVSLVFGALSIPDAQRWSALVNARDLVGIEPGLEPEVELSTGDAPVEPEWEEAAIESSPALAWHGLPLPFGRRAGVALESQQDFDVVAALLDPNDERVRSSLAWTGRREAA